MDTLQIATDGIRCAAGAVSTASIATNGFWGSWVVEGIKQAGRIGLLAAELLADDFKDKVKQIGILVPKINVYAMQLVRHPILTTVSLMRGSVIVRHVQLLKEDKVKTRVDVRLDK